MTKDVRRTVSSLLYQEHPSPVVSRWCKLFGHRMRLYGQWQDPRDGGLLHYRQYCIRKGCTHKEFGIEVPS